MRCLHVFHCAAIFCALFSRSVVRSNADHARGGAVTKAASEALKMIDTFASVGANRIHVTKTDINNDVKWG